VEGLPFLSSEVQWCLMAERNWLIKIYFFIYVFIK